MLFVLMAIGVPVAFSLGLSSVAVILLFGDESLASLAGHIFGSMEHYTLMAIPFFILASSFLSKGGSAQRLVDFAIARAGASTLWELSAIGCPTMFIPYPYAAGDHQYYNAQFLVEQGVAWIMRENDINSNKIIKILDENMREKSSKLQQIIQKDGALQIANLLREYN